MDAGSAGPSCIKLYWEIEWRGTRYEASVQIGVLNSEFRTGTGEKGSLQELQHAT